MFWQNMNSFLGEEHMESMRIQDQEYVYKRDLMGWGGVGRGRLEFFRKSIRFGTLTRPLEYVHNTFFNHF